MIPVDDAIRKFEQVIARVDPRLVLDRGNVRSVTEPYPGVEFGLRLGAAAALLFMPEGDLAAGDWEARLFKRFEAARRYLDGFPGARAGRGQTAPGDRRAQPTRRTPPTPHS